MGQKSKNVYHWNELITYRFRSFPMVIKRLFTRAPDRGLATMVEWMCREKR